MIRSVDYLSAADQFNALATIRKAAGFGDSAAATMRRIDALSSFGRIGALRQQIENMLGPHERILSEARKVAGWASKAEEMRKRHSSLFVDMERCRRMATVAIGPLSALRLAALYESEAMRLAKSAIGPRRYLDVYSATDQLRTQQEMLAMSFGEPLARRWISSTRDIAKQFSLARDIIEPQMRAFGGAPLFDAAQLTRSLGMPVMDHASFAAVARSSGIDGVMAQFRSLGIDQETLRRVASAVADDDVEAEVLLGEAAPSESPSRNQLTRAQLARLWNLFLILYNLLMPIYALVDSSQMEERLKGEIQASGARTAAEIKTSEERTNAKLAAMSELMERVLEIAEQEVLAAESMVVRERMAVIRSKPESRSSVTAEAFPNQVVTLLEERGKWIKVEYYDWIAREERTGWTLKKYLVRAKPR